MKVTIVSHIVGKSIRQRIAIVQFGGDIGMNQNFGSVLDQVSSDFTNVPQMVV